MAPFRLGLPIVPAPVIEVRRLVNGKPVTLGVKEAKRLTLYPHLIEVGNNNEHLEEVPLQAINFDKLPTALDYCGPESPNGETQWLFVLGDIGVKNLGRYKLRFALYPIEDRSTVIAQIDTQPFPVVPRDNWPLREDWFTPLSARLKHLHPEEYIHSPEQPRRFPDTDAV